MKTICKVWNDWKIEKEIGRGSYGTVYRCFKIEDGIKEYAAIKVISVPQNDYELNDIISEKMSEEQTRVYYKDIANELIKEIEILKALKGTKNIVEIYDAEIIEKEDGIGWNILIRMELLTDFKTYSSDKKFTEAEVIKLGLDLSNALSVCHKSKIIHRDIKPENIFIDDEGTYKLGDFGVAKQMEKTLGSMSVKGTYNYMSPEVFSGRKSDGRADMYSLALVMYKLLNNDRLPFLDPNKQIVRYSERQAAFERRIKGDALPTIPDISKELNAIILKACAFKNSERQKNIDEFRSQLEKLGEGKKGVNKSIIGFIAAAVVVAVCGSALAATAYNSSAAFRNLINGTNKVVAEEPSVQIVKVERNPKLSASLRAPGKTFLEHNKVGEKYLLEIADTQYLIDYKTEKNSEATQGNESADSKTDLIYTDICKELGLDSSKNDVYLYDGKNYYYAETQFDDDNPEEVKEYSIYRYNIENAASECLYTDKRNSLVSIVYCDDENMYFVDKERNSDEKKLNFLNLDYGKVEKTIPGIDDVFAYKGYIVYTRESDFYEPNTLQIEDTFIDKTFTVSDKVLAGNSIYFAGGKICFLEADSEGDNFCVSMYDLNKKIKFDKAVSEQSEEAEIPDEPETKVICFSSEFDSEITAENVCAFNNKYCIIKNEVNEETIYHVWSYKDKAFNEIELPVIVPPEDYETEYDYSALGYVCDIFSDKDISDKMLLLWCEGYAYRIYEISSDGKVKQVCNDNYFKEPEFYLAGNKLITLNDDRTIADIYNYEKVYESGIVEYTDCFDLVYIAANVLNVRICPYRNSSETVIETPEGGTVLQRIATGDNDWFKVIYQDKVAYMFSTNLKKFEADEADMKVITDLASSIVYKNPGDIEGIIDSDNLSNAGFVSTIEATESDRTEEITDGTPHGKLFYNFKVITKFASSGAMAAKYEIRAELITSGKEKGWNIESVNRTYMSDGLRYREALEKNVKYSAANGDKYFVTDLDSDGKNEVITASSQNYAVYGLKGESPKKLDTFKTNGGKLYMKDAHTLYYLEEKTETVVVTTTESEETEEAESVTTAEGAIEAAEVAEAAEAVVAAEVEVTEKVTKTTAVYITLDGDKIKTWKEDVTGKTLDGKQIKMFSVDDFSGLRF
ncbi:MAG: serine/threonine protein kinase [Clostridia bacterium]|nr:serine/threonine protein kinase [Clostridia bacterium]